MLALRMPDGPMIILAHCKKQCVTDLFADVEPYEVPANDRGATKYVIKAQDIPIQAWSFPKAIMSAIKILRPSHVYYFVDTCSGDPSQIL